MPPSSSLSYLVLKVLQENTTAASPGTTRSSPFYFDQYYDDDDDDDDDGDNEDDNVVDDGRGGERDGDNDCPDQDRGVAHRLEPLTPDKVEPRVTFSQLCLSFVNKFQQIYHGIFVETFQ